MAPYTSAQQGAPGPDMATKAAPPSQERPQAGLLPYSPGLTAGPQSCLEHLPVSWFLTLFKTRGGKQVPLTNPKGSTPLDLLRRDRLVRGVSAVGSVGDVCAPGC